MTTDSDAPIEIRGLVKTFGNVRALDGLDLTVARGEVHGFLGPNGAGKSTTIRVLLGLLRKDAGEVGLFGGDPWRQAAELHRRLAYVPGDVNLWPNLTGGQAIDLLGRLRGGLDEKLRAELIERFELDPTKKGRSYSKGNRQKVALVAALVLRRRAAGARRADLGPRPADGGRLPGLRRPVPRRRPRRAAEQPHPGRGRAALRPGQHHPGRPCASSPAPSPTSATSRVRRSPPSWRPPPEALRGLPHVHDLVIEGNRARFEVETDGLDAALDTLQAAGVRSLTSQPPTLEELFLRHYGEQIDDEEPAAHDHEWPDRHRPAAADVPVAGPLAVSSGGRSASRSSTGARRSASTGSTRPRRSSTRPPRAWRATPPSSR